LSAKRIHQDLIDEHQFKDEFSSVKRYVAKLGNADPLPLRRLELPPGEEAQIDCGTGAPVIGPDGKGRRTHVIRVVLSYSRTAYSEVVNRKTTDVFIQCPEHAFEHFGDVPKRLVPDNLKAAVIKADWYDPDLNPKLQLFCEHYGTVLMPTKPRTPRHKGKVERGVAYVQDNAPKGRRFSSLQTQKSHLQQWESSIADTRIHGTTKRQMANAFSEEKSLLHQLPSERFPSFHEGNS
jgi:transposase